jgi:putative ABC transport system permease protein
MSVAGRNFSSAFPSDSVSAVMVNETFVKQAGLTDPVGQELSEFAQEGPKHTIIGVVKDYHFNELTHAISPQLFVLNNKRPVNRAVVRLIPGSETRAMKKIEATFKELFPMSAYEYVFLDDRLKSFYEGENKWRRVMLFGAVLTIFVSCIGIFGLSLLSAEKRFKEIGIRKVLGATINSIVALLSREYLVLVAASIIIAIPVAYLLAERWLESYPYRINLGYGMFIISACIITVIALSTVGYQSLKAALTNPVRWLRSD